MKTSTALKKAKARLKGKWCKGAYYASLDGSPLEDPVRGCCVCAVGAVKIAVGDDFRLEIGAENELAKQVRVLTKGQTYAVEHYNDAPRRTEAQVLRLFDRAIEACKKRGD